MRKLYVVFIPMHTKEELDDLGESVYECLDEIGERENAEEIMARTWAGYRRFLEAEGLFVPVQAKRLHIFVDSLPKIDFPGIAPEVIQNLMLEEFKKLPKSPMIEVVVALCDKGAALHGTEDIKVLTKGIALLAKGGYTVAEFQHSIVERNDVIATSIYAGIPPDGIGIVFLGFYHRGILEHLFLTQNFEIRLVKAKLSP